MIMVNEALQILVDISSKLEISIHQSIVNLQDPLMAIAVALACISIATTWEGYFSATYSLSNLFIKMAQILFYMFLIRHWDMMMTIVKQSAENLGKIAGGADDFATPTKLVADGVDAIFQCYSSLIDNFPSASTANFVSTLLVYVLAIISLGIALYGLYKIAFVLFMANAEFLILGGLSMVLLPFALLRYTENMAEKTWGILLTSAVKVMVAVFMVCLVGQEISNTFNAITSETITEQTVSSLLLSATSLVFLSYLMGQAVEYAGAMTSGLSVNTGNVLHTVTPSRGTVMAAGGLVARGTGTVLNRTVGTAARKGGEYVKNKVTAWWKRSHGLPAE